MSYNSTTEVITAPVDVRDIRQAIGEGSADIGELCQSNKVQRWAKYKPMALWRTNPTADQPVLQLNDTLDSNKQVTAAGSQRINNLFGLKIPSSYLAGIQPGAGVLGRLMRWYLDYDLSEGYDWAWQKPIASYAQPARYLDFNSYCHVAHPINTDTSLVSEYGWPSDIPYTMISTIANTEYRIAIDWPTDPYSISWADMLPPLKITNGTWYFSAEVYSVAHGQSSTASEGYNLGLEDINGNAVAPLVTQRASQSVPTSLASIGSANMSLTIPFNDTLKNAKYLSIIYGFIEYDSSDNPYSGVLAYEYPIRKIKLDGNWPFGSRYTGIGYTNASSKFSTFLSSSDTSITSGITTGSADLWFRFTISATSSLIIQSSQLSAYGYGQHGEKKATSCSFCDQGSSSSFPSHIQSVTLNTGDNVVYVHCTGILQRGEQAQFIIKFTNASGTTEMGNPYIKVTCNA